MTEIQGRVAVYTEPVGRSVPWDRLDDCMDALLALPNASEVEGSLVNDTWAVTFKDSDQPDEVLCRWVDRVMERFIKSNKELAEEHDATHNWPV